MNLRQSRQPLLAIILLIGSTANFCWSQNPPPKTLRDQVHEKGSARGWVMANKIVNGPYGFREVVNESSLIIEAAVVAADSHLTKDEQSVATDYSLQVYQVLKDVNHLVKTTGLLTLTVGGGKTTVDGGSVEVQTNIEPLRTGELYILLLDYEPSGNKLSLLSEYGVFRVNKNVVKCDENGQLADSPCDKTLSDFYASLTKVLTPSKPARE